MKCAEHIIQLRILSYSIYRSNASSQRDCDVDNENRTLYAIENLSQAGIN